MGTVTQELLPLGPVKFETSPTIGQLAKAMAAARKAFKPVLKDAVNPFFKSKYADLASVIDATKDGLADNGLAIFQPPVYNRDGAVQIITLLAHSSGEWIKSILDITMSKTDAQGIGSAITYGRRYAYSAIVNVASEEDDDANAAVSKEFKPHQKETDAEFEHRTADQQNISVTQIQAIDAAIKSTGKSQDEVIAALAFIGEKRIEHIKKNQFDKFLKWASGAKKAGNKSTGRDAANKKLWALAAEYSIPEDDVKKAAYEMFGVETMTELTEAQLIQHAEWIKSVAV